MTLLVRSLAFDTRIHLWLRTPPFPIDAAWVDARHGSVVWGRVTHPGLALDPGHYLLQPRGAEIIVRAVSGWSLASSGRTRGRFVGEFGWADSAGIAQAWWDHLEHGGPRPDLREA